MGPPSSFSAVFLGLVALSSLIIDLVGANLRCYSCAPCNEFEFFAGDLHHFEISGATTDIFGYRQEVAIRGCPWVSLLANFEEGCTQSAIAVAGAGLVEGTVCLCRDHLCNGSERASSFNFIVAVLSTTISSFIMRIWYS